MPSTPEPQPGDIVLVTAGPFAQFTGPVRAVEPERNRVQLIVQIFGDDTHIDISLDTVTKMPNT